MSGQDLTAGIRLARQLDAEFGDGAEAADAAVDQWDSLLTTAALREAPPAQRALVLDGAAGGRLRRYWLTEQPDDLDVAVVRYGEALRAATGHPKVAAIVANNLARALERRYDDRERGEDLDEAVHCYEQAGQAGRLGVALRKRFSHRSTTADLEAAVSMLVKAVEALPEDAVERPALLRELAEALLDRYELRDALEDLESAVHAARESTDADADDTAAARNTLANALLTRFERRRADTDLDEAIGLLETVADDQDLTARTTALAGANLAGALVARWNTRSLEEDLDRAVDLYARALGTPDLSDRERLGVTNDQAAALDDRFHARGVLADLDRAVNLYAQVVDATPLAAPERPGRLNNLAIALRTRHVRAGGRGRPDDLERAIRLHREALDAPTAAGVRAAALQSNLGNALRTRYDASGDAADLRAAVSCYERAVSLTGENNADRAAYLNNLGAALAQLGTDTDDLNSLERARAASAEAVDLTPEGATELARYQLNLANVLSDAADRAPSDAAEQRATELYQDSGRRALVTRPEDALAAAANWSEWAGDHQRWDDVATAGEIGAEAVSTLVAAQVLRDHKESWLRDAQGISARRARALGRLHRLRDAALAAETGRALLLSETLRTDRKWIDDLRRAGHAPLAEEFQQATDAVSVAQHQATANGRDAEMDDNDGDQLAQIRAARAELDEVVREIQHLPGFRDFLAPPDFSDVAAAAIEQPLVYLVPADDAGLALVVRGEDVTHLELPGLTTDVLRTRAEEYLAEAEAFRAAASEDALEDALRDWSDALDRVTKWLWDEAMDAVLREVQPDTAAVLVAGGLLGLLPLHAAWTQDATAKTGRRYAMDTLTLSYVPNARSLTAARAKADGPAAQLIAIADPTPDPLPLAIVEASAVASMFGEKGGLLPLAEATPAGALSALGAAQVALFSCHAYADLAAPLESGFLLQATEGREPEDDPFLRLRDLLPLNLGVRLAVLSACETSRPGTQLPDEVVSLPTGLLQAGVGGAIASLWSVSDRSTTRLVLEFFRRWHDNEQTPAEALQGAQQWLRDATNAEKIAHINDATAMPWLTADAREALLEDLIFEEDDERKDAGLHAWAAFVHVGA